MKILFAVSNENVSKRIVESYQQKYQEAVSFKNVFYFNAIIREISNDKTYDRIVISEDLEPFANNNYDVIDKFILERLNEIAVETSSLEKIPGIIIICTDRRTKSSSVLSKMYEYGIYNALVGTDRRIDNVCDLINTPRNSEEAKAYYGIEGTQTDANLVDDVTEQEVQNILIHYKKLGKNEERYTDSFNNIASQYTDKQLKIIIKCLPINVRAVLEAECPKYQELVTYADETEEERKEKERLQEQRRAEQIESDRKLKAKIEKEKKAELKRKQKEEALNAKLEARRAKGKDVPNNQQEEQHKEPSSSKIEVPDGIDLLDSKNVQRMTGNVIIPNNMDTKNERKIYTDDELQEIANNPREGRMGDITQPQEVAEVAEVQEPQPVEQNVEQPNSIQSFPGMDLPDIGIEPQDTNIPEVNTPEMNMPEMVDIPGADSVPEINAWDADPFGGLSPTATADKSYMNQLNQEVSTPNTYTPPVEPQEISTPNAYTPSVEPQVNEPMETNVDSYLNEIDQPVVEGPEAITDELIDQVTGQSPVEPMAEQIMPEQPITDQSMEQEINPMMMEQVESFMDDAAELENPVLPGMNLGNVVEENIVEQQPQVQPEMTTPPVEETNSLPGMNDWDADPFADIQRPLNQNPMSQPIAGIDELPGMEMPMQEETTLPGIDEMPGMEMPIQEDTTLPGMDEMPGMEMPGMEMPMQGETTLPGMDEMPGMEMPIQEDTTLPGMDEMPGMEMPVQEDTTLPGMDEIPGTEMPTQEVTTFEEMNSLPDIDLPMQEDTTLPGVDELPGVEIPTQEEATLPGMDEMPMQEETTLPGMDEMPGMEMPMQEDTSLPGIDDISEIGIQEQEVTNFEELDNLPNLDLPIDEPQQVNEIEDNTTQMVEELNDIEFPQSEDTTMNDLDEDITENITPTVPVNDWDADPFDDVKKATQTTEESLLNSLDDIPIEFEDTAKEPATDIDAFSEIEIPTTNNTEVETTVASSIDEQIMNEATIDDSENIDESQIQIEGIPDAQPEQKRGRGRPRKYPIEPPKPKGKRGRPRKYPLPEEMNNEPVDETQALQPAQNTSMTEVEQTLPPQVVTNNQQVSSIDQMVENPQPAMQDTQVQPQNNMQYNQQPGTPVQPQNNMQYNQQPGMQVQPQNNMQYNQQPGMQVQPQNNMQYNQQPGMPMQPQNNMQYNQQPGVPEQPQINNTQYNQQPETTEQPQIDNIQPNQQQEQSINSIDEGWNADPFAEETEEANNPTTLPGMNDWDADPFAEKEDEANEGLGVLPGMNDWDADPFEGDENELPGIDNSVAYALENDENTLSNSVITPEENIQNQDPMAQNNFDGQQMPQDNEMNNNFGGQQMPQDNGMNNNFGEQQMPQDNGMNNNFGGQQMPQDNGMNNNFGGQQMPQDNGMQNNFGGQPNQRGQPNQPGFGMPNNFGGQPNQPGYGMPNNFGGQPNQPGFGMPNNFDGQPNQPGFGMPNNFGGQPNQPGYGMQDNNQQNGYGMSNGFGMQDMNDAVASYQSSREKQEALQRIEENRSYSTGSLNSILTKDKKIVAFVGASKSGTSFLVNNLACLFSSIGVKTAILDMTRNKNSYFIYTNNDENLRNIAYNSIDNLEQGVAQGIQIDRNLNVYTSVPGEPKTYPNAEAILSTLIQNESLVLIDCDFETDLGYFANAQEIYLVQSMDILTIQPLTAFLRELKTKGILEQEKLRIVVNKETKVRGLSSKAIIGGISFYNDPAMSYMTELFNKDKVKACSIPLDENVYSRYLESVVNCAITISAYGTGFLKSLKILGNMVYPLLSKQTYGAQKNNPARNYGNNFSAEMNNTLNQMKKKF